MFDDAVWPTECPLYPPASALQVSRSLNMLIAGMVPSKTQNNGLNRVRNGREEILETGLNRSNRSQKPEGVEVKEELLDRPTRRVSKHPNE